MGVQVRGVLVAGVLALAVSGRASAQKPADREAPKGKPCDMVEMTIRLRLSHPLGATRSEERQCPAHAGNWVRTFRMGDREALAWRRALAGLRGSADAKCRLAARTLVWLERTGLVSVWAPPDTTAGMVYYGATYMTDAGSPLAIQFWYRSFERPVEWLAGALAHEAYHALYTDATESQAEAFGDGCARRLGPPDTGDDELADRPAK